eukprot:gene14220-16348_t
MSQSGHSHSRISADSGQRLESTAHEASRKSAEAIAKSNADIAHGDPHPFHANQKPTHGFNETSLEMMDKMNPLDSPKKCKTHFSQDDEDYSHRFESVAHEEGRKAAEAIAKSKEDVAHGISLAPNSTYLLGSHTLSETASNYSRDGSVHSNSSNTVSGNVSEDVNSTYYALSDALRSPQDSWVHSGRSNSSRNSGNRDYYYSQSGVRAG